MKYINLLFVCMLFSLYSFADEKVFNELKEKSWKLVFEDSCTGKWQDKWFLDGDKAKVTNDKEAMKMDTANGFAVLWTNDIFEGDCRIEFDYKRLDEFYQHVNIVYIQATGDGQKDHHEDISKWADKRGSAAMKLYFLNMHTYHISFGAYANKPGQKGKDYIRGRRYMPHTNQGLKGTKIKNEANNTGLFEDKQWVHITIIKRDKDIFMECKHPDKTVLCHFENTDKPAVTKGRIGLRQMPKRLALFKNIKVMSLK